MDVKRLFYKENSDVIAHIEDFSTENVILENYFYSVSRCILAENFRYSDKEIALILHLTDQEYAELLKMYVSDKFETEENANVRQTETAHLQDKIKELEYRLQKSRDYEDANKNITFLESYLKNINSELKFSAEFESKYLDMLSEYHNLSYLDKYDLSKMHIDLVHLTEEIRNLDNTIHKHKGEQIQRLSKREGYDKGKIGLSIFWTLGILVLGAALLMLRTPFGVVLVGWIVGLSLTLMILYTAKIEVDYPFVQDEAATSIADLEGELIKLQTQRDKILSLVNVDTTDEFFHIKARFSACKQNLAYYKEEREKFIEKNNSIELIKKKEDIERQLYDARKKISDPASFLKPEEYLAIKREVDKLKLRLDQTNSSKNLTREQVINKLGSIRRELTEKIPQYSNVLRERFKGSYQSIKNQIDEYTVKAGYGPILVNEDGQGYDAVSYFGRFLIEYILIRDIYKENFAFIVQDLSSWKPDEKIYLDRFMVDLNEDKVKFYSLDRLLEGS